MWRNFLRPSFWILPVYLVVAEEAAGRIVPFGFLDRMKEEFTSKYGDRAKTAGPGSLTGSFGCACSLLACASCVLYHSSHDMSVWGQATCAWLVFSMW